MISITTPTNNPQYLKEAYDSLLSQTYQNWEWVIVPNGGAGPIELPPDARIRVVPTDLTNNVGAVKRFACEQAHGPIIVEFDHDDLLTPTALEQVAQAFEDDPELGFIYSNFAEFNMPNWDPHCYNAIYGWLYREREFYGKKFQEAQVFPPMPSTFLSLAFGPNHLRAWRATEYWKVGGHDPQYPVADDHDLYIRFYLQSKLRHIDDCLYLYRNHPDNTWRVMYDQVQGLAWKISDLYRHRIAQRWCELENLPMIDLGGGFDKPEGYTSLDLRGGDITADANKGLPFQDNSVGIIRAHDFLEHVHDKIAIMNEIYRVLVPNGWLLSLTPSTDGRGAYQDPTHVSYWNENCVTLDTWVLCADMSWRRAAALQPGDALIAFDDLPIDRQTPAKGRPRTSRHFRTSVVEHNGQLSKSCYLIETDSGLPTTASEGHRWLVWHDRVGFEWVSTAELQVGDRIAHIGKPWQRDKSWSGGWLAGMFDGEGCLSISDHKERRLRNGSTLVKRGSTVELATVTYKESVGEQPVCGIQTSTGTLITDGYLSHNSFWYYTNREYAKYCPAIKCRFQPKRLMTYFPFEWQERNKIPYVCADLLALKGDDRVPGLVEI